MSNIMDFWKTEWDQVASADNALDSPDPNPDQDEYNFKSIKVTNYDYNNIESNYETDGQSLLNSEKCLKYLRNTNPPTNTCAIKLSYALNKAGYYIASGKNTPANVRTQNDKEKLNNNFVLDARRMVNYLNLIQSPTLHFKTTELETEEKIETAIEKIHQYDDMRGIIGLVADNESNYGATGHVDLLYEDGGWDLSLYSFDGKDLIDYLKEELNSENSIKFDMSVWVLKYD